MAALHGLWKLAKREGDDRVFTAINGVPEEYRIQIYEVTYDYYEGHRENGCDFVHASVYIGGKDGEVGYLATAVEVPKAWIESLLEYLRENGVDQTQ